MTTPIKYRISSTATKPVSDTVKGAPLTSLEIDGNFRSIKDSIELIQSAYLPAGYSAPVDYVAGVILSSAAQTVAYQGEVYAPKAAEVPFTTSGTFEVTKFVQIQSVAGVDLAATDGASLVGYDTGTVQDVLDALTGPTGAATVGYTPAGTGAVATTVQSTLRETVSVNGFGAKGDWNGSTGTDNTAAIQSALDTNKSVYLPDGVYRVTGQLNVGDNRRIFGPGTIKSDLSTASCVVVSGKNDILFEGVKFIASHNAGISGDLLNAVFVSGSSNVKFIGCSFSLGKYSAGVAFKNSNNCSVSTNYFTSFDLTPSVLDQPTLPGVAIGIGCESIAVHGNSFFNIGFGVSVTALATYEISNISIVGNAISDCSGYGVLLYSVDSVSSSTGVKRCTIANNVIKNIYGTYLNPATSSYSHGAGIYLLNTEKCSVIGNTISNYCVSTNAETLSPAGVGVPSGNLHVVISGNNISDSEYYGILVDGEHNTVSGNSVKNTGTRAGIYSRVSNYLGVANNSISWDSGLAGTGQGIRIGGTGDVKFASINGNRIFNSQNPMAVSRTYDSVISANVCNTPDYTTAAAINGATNERVQVVGNVFKMNGGFGIRTVGTQITVRDNIVYGANSGQGIIGHGAGSFIGTNRVSPFSITQQCALLKINNATWLSPNHFAEGGTTIEVVGTGTVEGIVLDPTMPMVDIYIYAPVGTVFKHNSTGTTGAKFITRSGSDITVPAGSPIYHFHAVSPTVLVQI